MRNNGAIEKENRKTLPDGGEFEHDGAAVHVAGRASCVPCAPRGVFYLSFSVASPAIAERIARIQNPMTILLSGMPIISK